MNGDGRWLILALGVACALAAVVTRDRSLRNLLLASAAGFFIVDLFIALEAFVRSHQ